MDRGAAPHRSQMLAFHAGRSRKLVSQDGSVQLHWDSSMMMFLTTIAAPIYLSGLLCKAWKKGIGCGLHFATLTTKEIRDHPLPPSSTYVIALRCLVSVRSVSIY